MLSQIPNTANDQRQLENIQSLDICLTDEDAKKIDDLNCSNRINKKHDFSLNYDIFA
jgi:diketogulonate reductase-like aldo/keto reductase